MNECCTIVGQDYNVRASLAVTPTRGTTIVKGAVWVEYSDGLAKRIPLEMPLGPMDVEVYDIAEDKVIDTWHYNRSNSSGKYVIDTTYPFVVNNDYLIKIKVYLRDSLKRFQYPYLDDEGKPYSDYPYEEYIPDDNIAYLYDYWCSTGTVLEGEMILHFRKPIGRYVKLFDEELGVIIE